MYNYFQYVCFMLFFLSWRGCTSHRNSYGRDVFFCNPSATLQVLGWLRWSLYSNDLRSNFIYKNGLERMPLIKGSFCRWWFSRMWLRCSSWPWGRFSFCGLGVLQLFQLWGWWISCYSWTSTFLIMIVAKITMGARVMESIFLEFLIVHESVWFLQQHWQFL